MPENGENGEKCGESDVGLVRGSKFRSWQSALHKLTSVAGGTLLEFSARLQVLCSGCVDAL